jgi:hypothetical protein
VTGLLGDAADGLMIPNESGHQDDFADGRAILYTPVCLRRVGERQDIVDLGSQPALDDQLRGVGPE